MEARDEQRDRLQAVFAAIDGIDSLKGLHEHLSAHGFDYSYDSLTKWHRGERAAPADYYLALSRAFGFSLSWLIAGEGPIRPTEQIRLYSEFWKSIGAARPDFVREANSMIRAALEHAFARICAHALNPLDRDELGAKDGAKVAIALIDIADGWRSLFDFGQPLTDSEQTRFYTDAFRALTTLGQAVPPPMDAGAGTVKELLKRLRRK